MMGGIASSPSLVSHNVPFRDVSVEMTTQTAVVYVELLDEEPTHDDLSLPSI